jgi:type I restriction enzyme S subunit
MAIPINWACKPLVELGTFGKGKGLSGESMTGDEFTTEDFNMPCVGYGDIYMKYNILFDKAKNFTNEESAKESQKISQGALLFTGTGETAEEIGKCVCYTGDEDIYAGGDIILYYTNKVSPKYIAYQQYTKPLLKIKAAFGQGHSVVHIHKEQLEKLPCVFPLNIAEQHAIAECLDCFHNAIGLQTKLVAKLKLQKRALMQKLLKPQDDWQEVKLGDILELKHGYAFASENYDVMGDHYVITISNVQNGEMTITQDTKKVVGKPKDLRPHQELVVGDILVSLTGNVGRVCLVNYENCLLNQRVGKLMLKNDELKLFLYYILQSDEFIRTMQNSAVGAAQGNLSNDDIYNHKIALPKIEQAQNISIILQTADTQIQLNENLLEKYKSQASFFMEKLLSGKIRLPKFRERGNK